MTSQKSFVSYFRNFVFGVEDSLVSTVGLLSGVAAAGVSSSTIFLTGVVLIFVESFSMATGSFMSEYSADEYTRHTEKPSGRSYRAGAVMFLSYFAFGLIPLFPYAVLSVETAFWVSIIASLFFLFLLGVVGGEIAKIRSFRNGLRMMVLGGAAIAIGVLVGRLIQK